MSNSRAGRRRQPIIPSAIGMAALVLSGFLALAGCGTTPANAAKPKPYPLTTCIVSGDAIGTMGDPVVIVREGREIKFCCAACIKDFDKDPAKFLKMIDEAEKASADAKTQTPAETDHGHRQR